MNHKIARVFFIAAMALAALPALTAQEAVAPAKSEVQATMAGSDAVAIATVEAKSRSDMWKYIAAAAAVGAACVGGGLAVGQIGSAAMGAMSENAELSGKAIPFVGLAEGVCLWGFLVALLMILI